MKLQSLAILLLSGLALTACEGEAERMGENIDDAVSDASNSLENVTFPPL